MRTAPNKNTFSPTNILAMKYLSLRYISLAMLCFGVFALKGQVSLQLPVSNGYQYGLQNLLSFTITNPGEKMRVSASGEIRNAKNQLVALVETEPFWLQTGAQWQNAVNLKLVKKETQRNELYQAFAAGSLPPGGYTACLSIYNGSQKLARSCREIDLKAASPPKLAYPKNASAIKESYPALSWMPAITAASSAANSIEYTLTVYEVRSHQTAEEALLRNRPLLVQHGLKGTQLPYPTTAPELQEGKHYVWQVRAYYENIPIGDSETWTFQLDPSSADAKESPELALLIGDKSRVLHTVEVYQYLQFQVEPYMAAEPLTYTITSETGKAMFKKPRKLEKASQGVHYQIDLYTVPGLRKGEQYTLSVERPSGTSYPISFTYLKKR